MSCSWRASGFPPRACWRRAIASAIAIWRARSDTFWVVKTRAAPPRPMGAPGYGSEGDDALGHWGSGSRYGSVGSVSGGGRAGCKTPTGRVGVEGLAAPRGILRGGSGSPLPSPPLGHHVGIRLCPLRRPQVAHGVARPGGG